MRLSVIDIGTNTVLLLIADVDPDGRVHVVYDGHAIPRLGRGVDEHRSIPPESVARVLQCLRDYDELSHRYQAEAIIACGTSALRDASNKEEFRQRVKDELGFDVVILSGEREAELTYLGAVSQFMETDARGRFAVLDIGGGSTELTLGAGTAIESRQSLEIGCVRLTERILKTSPPSSLAMSLCLKELRTALQPLRILSSTASLIGVAGTLTTLASIDLALDQYDAARVNGHRLTTETVKSIFNKLRIRSVEEIRAIPQVHPGRADILLAGILILMETMDMLGVNEVTVSDRGLRYGIAAWKGTELTGVKRA